MRFGELNTLVEGIPRAVGGFRPDLVAGGGRGVRVAVIDSGWGARVADERIEPEIDLMPRTRHTHESAKRELPDPHGAHCIRLILAVAPSVQILPIRILDASLRTDARTLFAGLEAAADAAVDIVNLSLTVDDPTALAHLTMACQTFERRGMLVVAAAANGIGSSIPAVFPSVLGVRATVTDSPFQFFASPHEDIQCAAHGCVNGRMRNSYATATVSGLAALVCGAFDQDPSALRATLYSFASCRVRDE
ncbi:MAG: S8 family serine peptidase [Gemmatimonas sp.]